MKTVLFNPYTGQPRHPLDIQSDPEGLAIHDPSEPLLAATPTLSLPDTGNVGAIPEGMTEDDVMALARIASSENHYTGGRCVRMEFTPANILAFVAALPPPGRGKVPMTEEQLREVMESVNFTYEPTKFARAIEAHHGIKEGS